MSDAIEAVLRGAGLTDNPGEHDSSIHSWRCEHPETYGPCDCFQELVRELAEVERAAAEKALTYAIERVNAKAKAYADSAIGLRAEKEWADSNRYCNYAAGLDMASNEIHKAAEAYRQERGER